MKEIVITGEVITGEAFDHYQNRQPKVRRKDNDEVSYLCLKHTEMKFKSRDWQNKRRSPYKLKCIIEYMMHV